jgi:hypothetical protein
LGVLLEPGLEFGGLLVKRQELPDGEKRRLQGGAHSR